MNDRRDWLSNTARYVSPRTTQRLDAWSEELAESGRRGSQRLREAGEVAPPAFVTAALDLADGERAVVRRRVMLEEDQPVELTDSYYPRAVAAGTGLAVPRKIRGGAPTLLAELGYVADEVVEDLSVKPATPDEAHELALPANAPVIQLVRVSFTADGTPYEISVMTMRPEGRHFRYRLKVG
ncbi:GntR family transcriptional regulator [Nonomuraea sp. SBT364]|uniref:GntR family transcriptional regulator n=1 Tax=Nonomuraea sp. SBT364 TaxID=1580530 RepID=UPI00066A6E98|nr:UTRA domain-containing protein [Nonomuraea sp. SBT364]